MALLPCLRWDLPDWLPKQPAPVRLLRNMESPPWFQTVPICSFMGFSVKSYVRPDSLSHPVMRDYRPSPLTRVERFSRCPSNGFCPPFFRRLPPVTVATTPTTGIPFCKSFRPTLSLLDSVLKFPEWQPSTQMAVRHVTPFPYHTVYFSPAIQWCLPKVFIELPPPTRRETLANPILAYPT